MARTQLINAATVASWYNQRFINTDDPQVKARITIQVGSETLFIPSVNIGPGTTIDDMVRGFHAYLKENGPLTEEPVKQVPNDLGENVNFDQISYRDHDYMVEHWRKDDQDNYIVKRKSDGGEIKATSPNAKKIVKMFLEKFPPKPAD